MIYITPSQSVLSLCHYHQQKIQKQSKMIKKNRKTDTLHHNTTAVPWESTATQSLLSHHYRPHNT